jgi:hypothetical protein
MWFQPCNAATVQQHFGMTFQVGSCFLLVIGLPYSSTMKMETVYSTETLVHLCWWVVDKLETGQAFFRAYQFSSANYHSTSASSHSILQWWCARPISYCSIKELFAIVDALGSHSERDLMIYSVMQPDSFLLQVSCAYVYLLRRYEVIIVNTWFEQGFYCNDVMGSSLSMSKQHMNIFFLHFFCTSCIISTGWKGYALCCPGHRFISIRYLKCHVFSAT